MRSSDSSRRVQRVFSSTRRGIATSQLLWASFALAATCGVWLFYVQHQYEDVYWEHHEQWDPIRAALEGSSYYKLPKILQWFSGNIGLHHIHHLRPRIPNYNLQKCFDEVPELRSPRTLTFFQSLKCINLHLWDEKTRQMAQFVISKGADAGKFNLDSSTATANAAATYTGSTPAADPMPTASSSASTNNKKSKREQQLKEATQGGLRKERGGGLKPSTSESTAAVAHVGPVASAPTGAMEARLTKVAHALGFSSAVFKRVPKDYYDRPLEFRRECLAAPHTDYLCKTIVMHNTKCDHQAFDDPLWSKYYLVIIQYNAKFNNEKLIAYMSKHSKKSKKHFNFRLCPEEISAELTGFGHNGVTPLDCKSKLPMIISHRITQLPEQSFWLGAGDVDLKWKVSTAEFLRVFNPIVIDISNDSAEGKETESDE